MNATKLLKRNLALPIAQRIDAANVKRKETIARIRGNNAALLATIHAEIAPKLAELKRRDDWLFSGSNVINF